MTGSRRLRRRWDTGWWEKKLFQLLSKESICSTLIIGIGMRADSKTKFVAYML